MLERGSAALSASPLVHLIPSLTETSLSSDSISAGGRGEGGGRQGGWSGLLQGVLGNGPPDSQRWRV